MPLEFRPGDLNSCDYCGFSVEKVFTCPTCGDEYCEGCLMPAGAGVECLNCQEGSPCDVDEDEVECAHCGVSYIDGEFHFCRGDDSEPIPEGWPP